MLPAATDSPSPSSLRARHSISPSFSYESDGNEEEEEEGGNQNQERGNESVMKNLHKIVGAVVWTDRGVYRLVPNPNMTDILYALIAEEREKDGAEALGHTLGVDVLRMFERAGDYYFHSGIYGRAFGMYFLSNDCSKKILFNFLRINRMNEVMSHLRVLLHRSSSTSLHDREWISLILFECHLQQAVVAAEKEIADASANPSFSSPSENLQGSMEEILGPKLLELCIFLIENEYCKPDLVLERLLDVSLHDCFFFYAQHSDCVHKALQLRIDHGHLLLLNHQLVFLVAHGHIDVIRKVSGGLLYESLDPRQRLFILIPPLASLHLLAGFPRIVSEKKGKKREEVSYPFVGMGTITEEDWVPEVRNAYHLGALVTPDVRAASSNAFCRFFFQIFFGF